MTFVSPEELARCIEVLQYLVEDRARLATMASEERVALLIAAGRLSRPTRDEGIRENKAFRRFSRKAARDADRALRAETAIRVAREATVFEPPLQLSSYTAPVDAPEL